MVRRVVRDPGCRFHFRGGRLAEDLASREGEAQGTRRPREHQELSYWCAFASSTM